MAIKTFNPTTPSRRNMTVLSYKGLSKVKPEKSLLEKVKKTAGRNSYGRITVRHIGGGNKKKYRIIDFKRQKLSLRAGFISPRRGTVKVRLCRTFTPLLRDTCPEPRSPCGREGGIEKSFLGNFSRI